MSDKVYGKHYDEMVVAYEYLLTAMIKCEVLRDAQFDMLLSRLASDSGLNEDEVQLTQTYLRAIRTQAYE